MMQCFRNLEENNFVLWSKEVWIIGLNIWTRTYKVCVWEISRTQCGNFKCTVGEIFSMHRLSTIKELCSLWSFYSCCAFLDVQVIFVPSFHLTMILQEFSCVDPSLTRSHSIWLSFSRMDLEDWVEAPVNTECIYQVIHTAVYCAWKAAQADSLLPGI